MITGGCNCIRCNEKGFRFQPTDEELVDHHLRKKILLPHSSQHYINDIEDLSQFEPQELFRLTQKNRDDKEGYFFWSPIYKNDRVSRKGKNGFWSETCGCVPVTAEDGEEKVGEKRVFVFCEGVYPGKRTSWFIHQFQFTASHPNQEDHKEIFLCKLIKQKDEKDRVSGKKRKSEKDMPETSTKKREAKDDYGSRKKKGRVSSTKEARPGDKDLLSYAKNSIISCEEPQVNCPLPSDPFTNIATGDEMQLSYHLPSKDNVENISNNIPEGDHSWSNEGSRLSYGFPSSFRDDSVNCEDNRQSHHLSSNSITIFIGDKMQLSHHFPPNMSEDISNNEDARYNSWSNDEAQLSCPMPSVLKSVILNCEGSQPSHHLSSNSKESILSYDACEEIQSKQCQFSQVKGDSFNYMEGGSDAEDLFNSEELAAQLGQPQSPIYLPPFQTYEELPPSSDLNSDADGFQNQSSNNEQDEDANFWNSTSYWSY